MMENALNNLEKRSNVLKSKLLHEQLTCGSYSFNSFRREMSLILREYLHKKSLFKSSLTVGVNPEIAFKWYLHGQNGNPNFRIFYLRINHINARQNMEEITSPTEEVPQIPDGEFTINEYGDGWSYTTYVGGEKIFIISNELESLKEKIKSQNLPIN